MGLVLVGVLGVFFIVAMIFSAKTWRWHHLTALFFVFVFSIGFMYLAARSLKARGDWLKVYEANKKKLKEVTALKHELSKGKSTDIDPEPSVRSEKARLHRVLLSRGRIWRNCTEGNNAPAAGLPFHTVTLTTRPDAAGNPTPTGFKHDAGQVMGQVVYAFIETEYTLSEDAAIKGYKVPWIYMGEFSVSSAQNGQVQLRSTTPLKPEQLQQFGKNQTWVMYEHMPIDNHYAYTDGNSDPENYFGVLDQKTLDSIFTDKKLQNPQVRDQFLRDGKPLENDSDAPPENVWIRLKFNGNRTVQVDSGQSGALLSGDFDSKGQARSPQLKHGTTDQDTSVNLKAGDEVVMLKAEADALLAMTLPDGKTPLCEKIGKAIYVRSLRDYRYIFNENFRTEVALSQQLINIQEKLRIIKETVTKMTAVNEVQRDDKKKLTEDLTNFTRSEEAITAYRKKVVAAKNDLLQQLSRLYNANRQLAKELAQMQEAATKAINRRTAAAAANATAGK